MRAETTRQRHNKKPRQRPVTNGRPPRKRTEKRAVRRTAGEPASNVTIRKRGKVYYMFHKQQRRIPWRLVISLLLVFLCGVGSAVSFAQIHSVQRQITQLRQRYSAQIETNITLEAIASERYTHEMIAQRARELGLAEPDPSQIIYFYAPHHNHVVITYDQVRPQENYFWQGIREFFGGIVDRVLG